MAQGGDRPQRWFRQTSDDDARPDGGRRGRIYGGGFERVPERYAVHSRVVQYHGFLRAVQRTDQGKDN